jgi:hypothetical protein
MCSVLYVEEKDSNPRNKSIYRQTHNLNKCIHHSNLKQKLSVDNITRREV